LGIPEGLDIKHIFDKNKLFDELSIENWILPACLGGHINEIIWVRAPWCQQIKDGTYEFSIGQDVNDGKIKTSLKEDYFIADCCYQEEKLLKSKSKVLLHVVELSKDKTLLSKLIKKDYILDIDLDYFSTQNPFLGMLYEDDFQELRKVYETDETNKLKDPIFYQKLQQEKIKEMKTRLKCLYEKKHPTVQDNLYKRMLKLTDNYRKMSSENEEDVNFSILHNAGMCCHGDAAGVPHHPSSKDQILDMMNITIEAISLVQNKPIIATISRSSTDDYCPADQVDFIQDETLKIISKLHKKVELFNHYKQE